MRGFRGYFPFRLGGTSWVIPGTFEENMRALARRAEDMELVLFDSPKASNLPLPDEVRRLAACCKELDMTCTVHFPVDIYPSSDPLIRSRAEDQCLRVCELFAPLEPFAWILHLVGERTPPTLQPEWVAQTSRFAARLGDAVPDRKRICVETLDYPFDAMGPLIEATGFSVCLDIGHILRYGFDLDAHLERWLPLTRVVHLHGVMPDGTDHVSLSHLAPGFLTSLLERIAADRGARVVTLEVFEDDFRESLDYLEQVLPCELNFVTEVPEP